jgi:hypothetical protein
MSWDRGVTLRGEEANGVAWDGLAVVVVVDSGGGWQEEKDWVR